MNEISKKEKPDESSYPAYIDNKKLIFCEDPRLNYVFRILYKLDKKTHKQYRDEFDNILNRFDKCFTDLLYFSRKIYYEYRTNKKSDDEASKKHIEYGNITLIMNFVFSHKNILNFRSELDYLLPTHKSQSLN